MTFTNAFYTEIIFEIASYHSEIRMDLIGRGHRLFKD